MPAPNYYLKRERQLKGWSQVYLAEQIEVHNYYISRWERGEVIPSPYYQQKLCDLFGKTAEELGFLQAKDASSFASPFLAEDEFLSESNVSTSPDPSSIAALSRTVSHDGNDGTRDILHPPHEPSSQDSLLLMMQFTHNQEDKSLQSLNSSVPQTLPPAFGKQTHTQFRQRKRNVYIPLLLVLLSTVVIVLLFSLFGQALTNMLWHAPAATSIATHIKPIATPIRSKPINSAAVVQPQPTPALADGSVQINAGGSAVGVYSADMDYTDGSIWSTDKIVDTNGVSNAAPESIYQTSRYGYDFTYLIPHLTPHEAYMVRLHFAAMSWTQPGQNVFDVTINGDTALGSFDINAAAGGTDIAVVKSFIEIARSDGTILMEFDADEGYVMVSGIQVLAD